MHSLDRSRALLGKPVLAAALAALLTACSKPDVQQSPNPTATSTSDVSAHAVSTMAERIVKECQMIIKGDNVIEHAKFEPREDSTSHLVFSVPPTSSLSLPAQKFAENFFTIAEIQKLFPGIPTHRLGLVQVDHSDRKDRSIPNCPDLVTSRWQLTLDGTVVDRPQLTISSMPFSNGTSEPVVIKVDGKLPTFNQDVVIEKGITSESALALVGKVPGKNGSISLEKPRLVLELSSPNKLTPFYLVGYGNQIIRINGVTKEVIMPKPID